MDLPLRRVDHGDVGCFFLDDPDGGEPLGEMSYYWRGRLMVITHTRIDPRLKGGGAGRRLVEAAVAAARAEGFKILPQCPYAARTFDKTPAWADVRHRY